MYVAVKGGEQAILNSYKLLGASRRGDPAVPELTVLQIQQQMRLAVDRVMTEGSVYDPELAALAIKQAAGDLVEAIFLLRAFRATLPRLGYTETVETSAMHLQRRISSTFKDVPGGQLLGPTYDYTQRWLDFSLAAGGEKLRAQHIGVSVDDQTGQAIGLAMHQPHTIAVDRQPRAKGHGVGDATIEERRVDALGFIKAPGAHADRRCRAVGTPRQKAAVVRFHAHCLAGISTPFGDAAFKYPRVAA